MFARTIAPYQHPLSHDSEERGGEAAAKVEQREKQKRLRQAEIIPQQQQRGEQQAEKDDEARRGQNDSNELDDSALDAESRRRIESALLGEGGALLALRKKDGRRAHP